jgi:hypothetical protein
MYGATDGARPWTVGFLASHKTVHVKPAKTNSKRLNFIFFLFIDYLLLGTEIWLLIVEDVLTDCPSKTVRYGTTRAATKIVGY